MANRSATRLALLAINSGNFQATFSATALLLIILSTSIQINQVNTLPAFLYNFASSLTNSQQSTQASTPVPPTQSNSNTNNNNQLQQAVESGPNVGQGNVLAAQMGLAQAKQDHQLSAPLNINEQQQQQQQLMQKAANGLQQQLSSMQTQAQRQLTGQNPKFHMLEVLSNMGKAIQQQLLNTNGNIQIITSPALGTANNKKVSGLI